MKYQILSDEIRVYSKDQFNIEHILECGQTFCFEKTEDVYIAFPQNKIAKIHDNEEFYSIFTSDVDYFTKWFDLDNDYLKIKSDLSKFEIMKNPIEFGYGIRILNQDKFETIISFIISANNNIKRISLILNRLRKLLGEKIDENYYSFPSLDKMLTKDEHFYKEIGAGYRAKYLEKVCKQLSQVDLLEWEKLDTKSLRDKLISLAGVGPKVADCILLFGFGRQDVFPVDTWINQMYNKYYDNCQNRNQIRNNLVAEFGQLSGYAQQYLFYFQRSKK